mgnify:CR=1 FL=1
MKKFSKLIALVLVLSLVFAFTACGKGGSDDTIKLGILCSLTGNSQTNGGYAQQGAKMAVEEINAAGGINTGFRPGNLMLIEDHLNLTGENPLIGENLEAFGERFFDMTVAYDREYRTLAENLAAELDIPLQKGVYAWLTGPNYETPAEIRYLRTIGADAVGMSTVPEVLVARHCGLRVCGISCITNLAAGMGEGLLSHEEVKETADRVKVDFIRLVTALTSRM